eukprot:7689466-Heterocapsa_arctica.AAC.1
MTGRRTGRKAGPLRTGRRLLGSGRLPGTGRSGPGSRRPGSAGPPKSASCASGWGLEGIKKRPRIGGSGKSPGK